MVKFAVPMLLALMIVSGARAEDAKEEKISGKIAAAPAGAKAGVIAVLTTHKGKDGTEGKSYNLTADGAAATQIADFVAKGAKVDAMGSGTTDSFKVSSITEHKGKPKPTTN
jgi:hypothetical protein